MSKQFDFTLSLKIDLISSSLACFAERLFVPALCDLPLVADIFLGFLSEAMLINRWLNIFGVPPGVLSRNYVEGCSHRWLALCYVPLSSVSSKNFTRKQMYHTKQVMVIKIISLCISKNKTVLGTKKTKNIFYFNICLF